MRQEWQSRSTDERAAKPGSLVLRAVAVLLDSAIIFLLAVVLIGRENLGHGAGLAFYLGGWAAYYIGLTVAMGATPGKIALGLHVAGKTGGRASPDSVILRYIVMLVGALLFGIGTIASILMVLTDPQRRSLHDRIAGTLVLDGRPPIEEWQRRERRDT
jgi:uncharacterized RDD family membrane protein YckC